MAGGSALEVEARADLLGGVFHGVLHFHHVRVRRLCRMTASGCSCGVMLMRQFSHDRGAKRTAAGAQQLRHRRQGADAGAGASRGRRPGRCWPHPEYGAMPQVRAGGGSNIVLTGDVRPLVLKVEVPGRRLIEDGPRAQVVEAGAGENWHDFVDLDAGPGLSGPGKPGADPGNGGRARRCRTSAPTGWNCRTASSRWTRSTCSDRQDVHAGCGAMRFRLPRFGVQARGRQGRRLRPRRPGDDPARAVSPAEALEAGARLHGPGAQDAGDRHPRAHARGRSTTGSAPSAAPSCPTRG